MDIIASGTASTRLTPDRATVHLTVTRSGPDQGAVVRATHERAGWLLAQMEALPGTAVSGIVTDGVTSYATPVWDGGRRTGTVVEASCGVRATFHDLTLVNTAVPAWGQVEGVQVGHTEWNVSDERRDEAVAALISAAIAEAERRGAAMATHLGATGLRVVRVQDADSPGGMVPLAARSMPFEADGPVTVRPDGIVLSQAVTITFHADLAD